MKNTQELLKQAIQLLSDSPVGGSVDLEGIPFKDMKELMKDESWEQIVRDSGELMLWNSTVENENGVHVGEITLHSLERATRDNTWTLPDGTPFSV